MTDILKSDIKHSSINDNVKDNEILEFELIGFARVSRNLLKYIRRNNVSIKIFSSAKTKGAKRLHGSTRILGEYYRYYYKVDHKNEFVNFLVDKFYKNNPLPSVGMRIAFTHILHDNGLHWEGCGHKNKDR